MLLSDATIDVSKKGAVDADASGVAAALKESFEQLNAAVDVLAELTVCLTRFVTEGETDAARSAGDQFVKKLARLEKRLSPPRPQHNCLLDATARRLAAGCAAARALLETVGGKQASRRGRRQSHRPPSITESGIATQGVLKRAARPAVAVAPLVPHRVLAQGDDDEDGEPTEKHLRKRNVSFCGAVCREPLSRDSSSSSLNASFRPGGVAGHGGSFLLSALSQHSSGSQPAAGGGALPGGNSPTDKTHHHGVPVFCRLPSSQSLLSSNNSFSSRHTPSPVEETSESQRYGSGSTGNTTVTATNTTTSSSSANMMIQGVTLSSPGSGLSLLTEAITEDTDEAHAVSDSDSDDPVPYEVTETRELRKETDEEGNKYINQYALIDELGRGSYGKVKLVQLVTDPTKLYAIKILNKSVLRKKSAVALELAQQEVAIMKKLRHKNIVSLYEVIDDEEGGKMYMVLQYAKGGCLMKIDSEGRSETPPFTLAATKKYFRCLVSAVRCSYRNGVVHRDIKPENCLLDADGTLKLSDFGVSAIIEDDDRLLDTEGTPAFLPPESLHSRTSRNGVSGFAVDMWAMGVTLYCFVYGKLPFFSSASRKAMVARITSEPLDLPEKTANGEDLDPFLQDVLLRLLTKDPACRIDMEELAQHGWVSNSPSGMPLTPLVSTRYSPGYLGLSPSAFTQPAAGGGCPEFSLGTPTLAPPPGQSFTPTGGNRSRSKSIVSVTPAEIQNAFLKGRNVALLKARLEMLSKAKRRYSMKMSDPRLRGPPAAGLPGAAAAVAAALVCAAAPSPDGDAAAVEFGGSFYRYSLSEPVVAVAKPSPGEVGSSPAPPAVHGGSKPSGLSSLVGVQPRRFSSPGCKPPPVCTVLDDDVGLTLYEPPPCDHAVPAAEAPSGDDPLAASAPGEESGSANASSNSGFADNSPGYNLFFPRSNTLDPSTLLLGSESPCQKRSATGSASLSYPKSPMSSGTPRSPLVRKLRLEPLSEEAQTDFLATSNGALQSGGSPHSVAYYNLATGTPREMKVVKRRQTMFVASPTGQRRFRLSGAGPAPASGPSRRECSVELLLAASSGNSSPSQSLVGGVSPPPPCAAAPQPASKLTSPRCSERAFPSPSSAGTPSHAVAVSPSSQRRRSYTTMSPESSPTANPSSPVAASESSK
ncbi:hypothetical protein DIPPA_19630 [Diplonema papillatum]|nr:hypothetical protein DIPPA_19630 [Diplonema papillatum]